MDHPGKVSRPRGPLTTQQLDLTIGTCNRLGMRSPEREERYAHQFPCGTIAQSKKL